MRIGLVIERFHPARGGRERSTAEVAEALMARGCDVEIVCMAGDANETHARVVELGSTGAGRLRRFAGFVRAARRHITASQYDVSHAMCPLPDAGIYQCRGGTLPGLRAAHLRMAGGPLRPLRRLTWPMNRPRALQGRLEASVMADTRTWILPVSEMVAEEVRRYYGRCEGVRTIFNGAAVPDVDSATRVRWRHEVRRRWGAADGDILLVCPAMNYRLKGVGPLLEAFGRLRRGPAETSPRLVVLGADAPRPSRRRSPDPTGGANGPATAFDVQFRPPADAIWPVYAAADAVVLLSWYDACSRVVLEAVGFGVPCLTTRFNGAAPLLDDGAGWVVSSPAATDEVVAALRAMTNRATLDAASAASRAAAPRVTIDRHADELMDVYREVAQV